MTNKSSIDKSNVYGFWNGGTAGGKSSSQVGLLKYCIKNGVSSLKQYITIEDRSVHQTC